jgi:hypothetical protein
MNRKSLVNIVLKRNSQKPNPSTLKILRYVAVEVLFRLSMMFLRTNETALLERIETTGLDVDGEHRRKIERLLVRMAPSPSQSFQSTSKQEFKHLEQWVGHNLFVTSIMFSSKTARNKPQFSKVIPQLQWTEFVSEQVKMGHEPPNLDSFLYPTTYIDAETRLIPSLMKRKSQQTESPKKQKLKETTGKLFGISCLLCKQSTSKQEFEHLEQWLGHNLSVTSIMFSSNTVKNKPQFSMVIPQLLWTEFVSEQVKMGYEPLNLDSLLYPTRYRDAETRLIPSPMKRKSQQTESPKKQEGNTRTPKETTGKSFGISYLLCKFITFKNQNQKPKHVYLHAS